MNLVKDQLEKQINELESREKLTLEEIEQLRIFKLSWERATARLDFSLGS
ncbi:MAG: hypothetical protein GY796_33350 [Chloroflexi bacterium]|nr:hypothetical protein [Chloroflexota bacterium]